ncbi:hypothetical protein SAMN05518865_11190 [Duganella sp. CF458]|uniref:hypothetical protein n=1 Tax=Duganella sp. CF458 TaxID=1884368 RepID=UPI0008F20436|nr:hypothetical protein [Duganella sp. CF458]SFG36449.1 hypothetical protein SAMN05518865_11190 [Duganella sp. CF458]
MHNKTTLQVLAAASGLGDERIQELWEGADMYARAQAGNPDSPRYQQVLHERMAAMVEREVAKRHDADGEPWVLADAHLGQIEVSLSDALKAFGGRTQHVVH